MQNKLNQTKSVYEDSEVVANYIKKQATKPKMATVVDEFSQYIKGKEVLDLGCGPGHDSYLFQQKGFETTGLDYSQEMISKAKHLKQINNPPRFLVGDMKQLDKYFKPNQFDAFWVCASLIHIDHKDLDQVLSGIYRIGRPNALVYIGIMDGQGKVTVKEEKYGKPTQRTFYLWQKDEFLKQTKQRNFKLLKFWERPGARFQGKPKNWLNFYFRVQK